MKYILLFVLIISIRFSIAQDIHPENLEALISFCDSTKADEILIKHHDRIITHWKRTDYTQVESEFANPACGSVVDISDSRYTPKV